MTSCSFIFNSMFDFHISCNFFFASFGDNYLQQTIHEAGLTHHLSSGHVHLNHNHKQKRNVVKRYNTFNILQLSCIYIMHCFRPNIYAYLCVELYSIHQVDPSHIYIPNTCFLFSKSSQSICEL